MVTKRKVYKPGVLTDSMNQQRALYLLEQAFDDGETVLAHGTSASAAIQLLETGKLPPARGDTAVPDHPINNGYLFFIPKKQSFVDHPLYCKIKIDLDTNELETEAASYALQHEVQEFLTNEVGLSDSEQISEIISLAMETLCFVDINEIPKVQEYGVERFYHDLRKRRGVVIGVNRKILELNLEDGSDVPGEEVMCYLPNGLDIQYVNHIFPCGELEENRLYQNVGSLSGA